MIFSHEQGQDPAHLFYRNVCQELPLELNAGTYKLFFSTVGMKGEISDGLKERPGGE